MPWTSEHLKWLVDTKIRLKTTDGKTVEVWEFRHEKDEAVLSAWAKHFRNHYCFDDEIDYYRKGYGCSRKEYLNRIKFPGLSKPPGPSIRTGDFGEILVADYVQYTLGYWVPRTRYGDKDIRNESTKGTDIIGFKITNDNKHSKNDTLAIFESKAQFTGKKPNPRLQDAVKGSALDHARRGESLNAIKQRLFERQKFTEAKKVERFQDLEGNPYKEIYGAVALFTIDVFDDNEVTKTDASQHPHSDNLSLVVIRGNSMMDLVHELYKRAADEA